MVEDQRPPNYVDRKRDWSLIGGGGGGVQNGKGEASEVLPLRNGGQKKFKPC